MSNEYLIQDIESRLLGSGQFKSLIFSDVDFTKETDKYYQGTCPSCEGKGKFQVSKSAALFHCYSGSCQWHAASPQDWSNWHKYKGGDWLELYKELARHAGVEWPESSEAAKAAHEAREKRSNELEDFYALAVAELKTNKKVLKYWESRGYDSQTRRKMGLGAYPENTQGEFAQFKRHKALYLLRDKSGRALGLMGRATEPDIEPKYLYSRGFQKIHSLTGIEQARGKGTAVLIESPLGAAYLNAQEFVMPVIGLGGASLSKEQLAGLKEAKVNRFVLALDNDEGGAKATRRLIEQLQGVGLRSLMVASWDNAKGLDDSYQVDKVTAEGAVLSSAKASAWLATDLINRSEFGTHIEQEIFFESAAKQFSMIDDGIERKYYKGTIAQAFGYDEETLNARFDEALTRATNKKTEKRLKQALSDSLSSDNPLLAAKKAQKEIESILRESRGVTMPEPYLLESAVSDIVNMPEGLPLGFESMASNVQVPRAGLSIIGAQSGVGKTTLMLNLLSNWLELAGDKRYYFYSYEEPKSHIMLKLVMIWAGVELHPELNFYAYINYLSEKRDNPKIEAALTKYEQLTSSGRLIIDDTMPAVEDLTATLSRLEAIDTGAVVLDYVQRIPSMDVNATRQLELAYITQQLRITAVNKDLAIVTGSQLNDEGKLREARDIYHEAALVLELYYPTPPKGEEDEPQPLTLTTKKQRAGRVGVTTILGFNKPVLKMFDIQGRMVQL